MSLKNSVNTISKMVIDQPLCRQAAWQVQKGKAHLGATIHKINEYYVTSVHSRYDSRSEVNLSQFG